MEGKQIASKQKLRIASLLTQFHIDAKKVVVGDGVRHTIYKDEKRFVFQARDRKEILEQTAVKAIKYFSEPDIYLVWNVEGISRGRKLKRMKFSVEYDEVMAAIRQNTDATKAVEFEGRGHEKVTILTDAALEGYFAALNI